jgi:hypothetical protein
MFISIILATSLTLTNTVPPAHVDVTNTPSFVDSCALSTTTLKEIQDDMPRYLELVKISVEILQKSGSQEHLNKAIDLYGRARKIEGGAIATKELACSVTVVK